MATLAHITDPAQKRQIARNLQIHAWYMKTVADADVFDLNDFELAVLHGLYRHEGSPDTLTAGSINDLAQTGRAITYQVINKTTRQPAPERTFDVAVFLKNFMPFEKLILNYDSYNPNGNLAASITIVVPTIPYNYVDINFANEIETTYNGRTFTSDELAEVTGVPQIGLSVNLSDDLTTILEATASTIAGLSLETTSAVRPGSSSGRHTRGDASDTALIYNGRRLTVEFAEDRELIQQFVTTFIQIARSRGFQPSVGVANHERPKSQWYMNGEVFHFDIAAGRGYSRPGGGQIVATVWGNGSRLAGAPQWLKDVYGVA